MIATGDYATMNRRGWLLVALAALGQGGAVFGQTSSQPVTVANRPPIVSAVRLRLPGASAVADPPAPKDDHPSDKPAAPDEAPVPVSVPASDEPAAAAPDDKALIAWTSWSNGRPIVRGADRNGVKQGVWTRWFHAGEGAMFDDGNYAGFERPFVSAVNFDNGLPNGPCTILDRHGNKLAEFTLVAGTLEGPAAWYYSDGQPRREVTFHEGLLTGDCRDWNENHELVFHEVYERGRVLGHRVERYKDGRTLAEGDVYQPGNVVHAEFDWLAGDWQTEFVISVPSDQRTGQWKWLLPNGLTKLEGTFRDGLPSGKFTWYTTNSQKLREGTYLDGAATGVWATWHPNGQKEAEGELVDGQPSGVWMGWDTQGRVHPRVPEAAMTPPALPE
ncbi:MAG TPA: hypothetical protein VG713_11665 [Pirellulales bacterium]|nr:hypothetical protein [Pirellulales bacterium]